MGAEWLHNLPSEAAKRGLTIATYPGWELRSRPTGGFDDLRGIVMHHTASPATWSSQRNMDYQWREDPYAPIANLYLGRAGDITIGAAGASNHAGIGGPWTTSRGVIARDMANRYAIGIEAGNNGTGERWSNAQCGAYLKLVWVLCDIYGFDPTLDVVFHHTWAPDRKIDPAGPTLAYPSWGGTSGARTWNLANFRNSVLDYNQVPIPDMSNFKITNPVRILETRGSEPSNAHNPFKGPFTGAIQVRPHGFTPGDVSGVILTIGGIGYVPGFFTFWNGVGLPPGSNLNNIPGHVNNNMVWVPLNAGTFSIYSSGRNDIYVDQVGWYWE